MSRTVLLPREFERKLDELATLEEEVNGILLYRPQQTQDEFRLLRFLLYTRLKDWCPIENIFMTGIGHEGHVQAEQQRMDVANEFFKRNPEYRFVKFHTHSKGTIRKFGDNYATQFSDGDIRSYEEQLRMDPEFIGMVVTPRTKLLYAPDNPTLRVVEKFPSNANEKINSDLREIARVMGYDFSRFQAVLKT